MNIMNNKTTRRASLKKMGMAVVGALGLGAVNASARGSNLGKSVTVTPETGVISGNEKEKQIPIFSGARRNGNTLYIAGKGAHFEGDIKSHTDHVLKELEKELIKNGSSMEKVLKVNVYLHDLEDYNGLNEVYRGRFGANPPVRTTVAVYGGVPGDSLVEMDCIAAID